MVRLSLAAGLAGLAGVSGFAPQVPPRPTTVLQYKKTAKEMRAKYPEGGKVPYVLTKDAPPHGVAGDVLKVNRGFANNYLAPQGLGEPASAEVIAAFEVKLAERAAAEALKYLRKANAPRQKWGSKRFLPETIQYVRVKISYGDGEFIETPRVVAENHERRDGEG